MCKLFSHVLLGRGLQFLGDNQCADNNKLEISIAKPDNSIEQIWPQLQDKDKQWIKSIEPSGRIVLDLDKMKEVFGLSSKDWLRGTVQVLARNEYEHVTITLTSQ